MEHRGLKRSIIVGGDRIGAAHDRRITVRPLPLDITEAAFQDTLLKLATTLGWMHMHQRPAKLGVAGAERWVTAVSGTVGWPDLVLLHPTRRVALFRELKSARGRLSDDQEYWGAALTAAGLDWAVWRPDQWVNVIVPALAGREGEKRAVVGE